MTFDFAESNDTVLCMKKNVVEKESDMQFEDWFFTHTNNSVEIMDDMHKAFLAGKASAIPDGYYDDLVCDICGVETNDPWHYSTSTSKHKHACDKCWSGILNSRGAIPDGYALVPVEPTRSMMASAVIQAEGNAVYKSVEARWLEGEETKYGDAYKAMIAAAQKEMK